MCIHALSVLTSNVQTLPPILCTASWPKLIISVDPQRNEKPFLTTHHPPLPAGSEINLSASNLSLEELVKKCVLERSHTHLRELKNVLNGTGWHKHGKNGYQKFVLVPLLILNGGGGWQKALYFNKFLSLPMWQFWRGKMGVHLR